MSNADGTTQERGRTDYRRLASYGEWFTTAIVTACFWTAVALPFLYVPLLMAGLETPAEGLAFAVLLVVNLVTLLVGHSYHSDYLEF